MIAANLKKNNIYIGNLQNSVVDRYYAMNSMHIIHCILWSIDHWSNRDVKQILSNLVKDFVLNTL